MSSSVGMMIISNMMGKIIHSCSKPPTSNQTWGHPRLKWSFEFERTSMNIVNGGLSIVMFAVRRVPPRHGVAWNPMRYRRRKTHQLWQNSKIRTMVGQHVLISYNIYIDFSYNVTTLYLTMTSTNVDFLQCSTAQYLPKTRDFPFLDLEIANVEVDKLLVGGIPTLLKNIR